MAWLRGKLARLAGTLLLLLLPARALHATPPRTVGFRESARVSIGHAPVSLALGDLNGDLRPDVVLANDDSTASTLLGDGVGGLSTPTERVVAPDLAGIALGEVNGDGRLDMAISASSSGCVFTWRGAGDGSFVPGDTLRAPWTPGALALVESAGTGTSDLVVADLFFQAIVLLQNDGFGKLSFKRQFNGFVDPVAISFGPVARSFAADMAVADQSSHIATLLVDFGEPGPVMRQEAPIAGRPVAVALGDLDGTGHEDLIVTTREPAELSVLLRAADGSLRLAHAYPADSDPRALALADFDGDGRLDAAVADHDDASISLWAGRGDGTFSRYGDLPTGAGSVALATADMNGDGWPDLVCANHDAGTVQVFLNTSALAAGSIHLFAPTPNPAPATTRLRFALSGSSPVRVELYDLTGRLVRRLVDGVVMPPGAHDLIWDGRTDAGDLARSGLYLVRLRAGGAEATTRLVLGR